MARPATAPRGSASYAARMIRNGWRVADLDPDTAYAWRRYRAQVQRRRRARLRGEPV